LNALLLLPPHNLLLLLPPKTQLPPHGGSDYALLLLLLLLPPSDGPDLFQDWRTQRFRLVLLLRLLSCCSCCCSCGCGCSPAAAAAAAAHPLLLLLLLVLLLKCSDCPYLLSINNIYLRSLPHLGAPPPPPSPRQGPAITYPRGAFRRCCHGHYRGSCHEPMLRPAPAPPSNKKAHPY